MLTFSMHLFDVPFQCTFSNHRLRSNQIYPSLSPIFTPSIHPFSPTANPFHPQEILFTHRGSFSPTENEISISKPTEGAILAKDGKKEDATTKDEDEEEEEEEEDDDEFFSDSELPVKQGCKIFS